MSWSNETLGIVLGASKFSFIQETDNYEPRFDAVGMREVRFAKYRIKRDTRAFNGKIEWRIDEQNSIRFSALRSEFLDFEERNQYTFNFAGAASGTRTPTSGSLVSVPVAGLFEDGDYATKNTLFILHGDHEFAGSWADRRLRSAKISHLQRHLRQQPATQPGPCCALRSRLRRERPERP